MPTIRTILLGALGALMLALVPASAATAKRKIPVRVGVADQSYKVFDEELFEDLDIKRTRYFIKWNAIKSDYQLKMADFFVDQAQQNGVEVLMTPSTDDLRRRRGRGPSVRKYRRYVGKLIERYSEMGVDEWGAWNEANHDSQPTWRSPRRAARFFKWMWRMCDDCKNIVALDVLDQRGVERYIHRFYKALGSRKWRRRAELVGIHNYSDVNRRRMSGTKDIIRRVRKYNRGADFWLTETGGLLGFGRAWPCRPKRKAERRQARSVRYMFRAARKLRRPIDRLYVYAYFGNDCEERFDAGLVDEDGDPRRAYKMFKWKSRKFKR